MIRKADKETKSFDDIQNWVMNFAEDPNPNHSQFSGAEVADMIMKYNRNKLSGKLDNSEKSCTNCKFKNDYPKCYKNDNNACDDWMLASRIHKIECVTNLTKKN